MAVSFWKLKTAYLRWSKKKSPTKKKSNLQVNLRDLFIKKVGEMNRKVILKYCWQLKQPALCIDFYAQMVINIILNIF